MKKNYFKFSSLALIAGMCVIASCDNDDEPIVNPNDSSTLHGAVTSDLTLKSGKTYTLNGGLIVKAGATLNIEEGVTVVSLYDDKVSRLSGVAISGTLDSKEGIYTNDKFVADGNTSNATLGYASLEDIAKECSWMNGWTR